MPDIEPSPRSIFGDALERPPGPDRLAYLDRACRDRPEIRAHVEGLLSAHDHVGTFLESPADPLVDRGEPAWVVGPYTILRPIGEGGMGTVYLAEQAQPVRRRVALKRIRPGLDSRQVLARFDAERQALAMMDHPNIARVLDAGADASGRPYFAMELVEGAPITEFCDRRRLPIRGRLELMIAACRAVQHAHQKGVIHRDLKPGNVLVALYDGEATPKVIDFGVAKATGRRLTEATLATECGVLIGTIEYMAPEQAGPGATDVDTRADVYGLGAVLYELVAGTSPLRRPGDPGATLLELLRRLRDDDPPAPSIVVARAEEAAAIASSRGADRRGLIRSLGGDLDRVVMKAISRDRDGRYDTAEALAEDLRRLLDGDPVRARPRGTASRISRWARRHRRALIGSAATSALAALGLALGSAVLVREKARTESNLAMALRALDEFGEYNDEEGFGHDPARAQRLQRTALELYDRLTRQEPADASARLSSARAYRRLGGLLSGGPHWFDPSRRDEVDSAYRSAYEVLSPLLAESPGDPRAREEAARVLGQWGVFLTSSRPDRSGEAADRLRTALAIERDLLREDPGSPRRRSAVARACEGLAGALSLVNRGDALEKERLLDEAARLSESSADRSAQARADLADIQVRRSQLYLMTGRPADSASAARRAHALADELDAEFPTDPRHRFAAASLRSRLLGFEPCDVPVDLASLEDGQSRAIANWERLAADFPSIPDFRVYLAQSHRLLAGLEARHGRGSEAEAASCTSIAILEALAREYPAVARYGEMLARARMDVGSTLIYADRLSDAETILVAALSGKPDSPSILANLAWVLAMHPDPARRDLPRASSLARRSLALRPSALGWRSLAVSLARSGDGASARSAIEAASKLGDDEPCDRLVRALAAYLLHGDPAEARRHYGFALEAMAADPRPRPSLDSLRAEAAAAIRPDAEVRPAEIANGRPG